MANRPRDPASGIDALLRSMESAGDIARAAEGAYRVAGQSRDLLAAVQSIDASRHFSIAAGAGVEHLTAAGRAGLFAIDQSIVDAATGWRANLIDAPHLAQAVNAVGGSVAAAIAAR